ncbi:chromosomal replication initiator DnaA, partial [Desulfovibrio sp. OttesenSCG-928-O18]|nr:chromosomal replication initiator DnaA [Desulfovibrio sp. OttesenSCG-928-O18]
MNKERIRDHLRTTHTDAELQTWFDPLRLHFPDSGILEVHFPHMFFSRWFGKERQKMLEREVAQVFGPNTRIVYVKSESDRSLTVKKTAPKASALVSGDYGQWSFDTFIYNKKNEFPVAMAREMAASAKNPVYSPFVICGKGTCGKTHLLRAIAGAMTTTLPPESIYLGTVEELNALYAENEKPGAFSKKMLRYKAFFLDNAQDLAAYPELQQELLTIGDAFREKKRPVVVAVDEDIDKSAMSQKLRSRLESGLVVAVKKPDLDIRLRYVKAQCAANRLHLQKEFILPLAQRFQNLRALQGMVTKIAAFQKRNDKPLTNAEFEKLLASSGALSGKPPTPQAIIAHVAEAFSLAPEDISGCSRQAEVVRARQIAMYLCRELLGASLSSLGRYFNGKNHATVLYACKKIKKSMDSDKDTHKLVT